MEDFFSFVVVNARLKFKHCYVICAAWVVLAAVSVQQSYLITNPSISRSLSKSLRSPARPDGGRRLDLTAVIRTFLFVLIRTNKSFEDDSVATRTFTAS